MIDLDYWNVRRDGRLIIRPGIKPGALYISFDPASRRFTAHNSYPLHATDGLTIEPDRIDPRAVAETTAYSILRR
ncbi:hypothetical protein PMI07_000844 [Rhizobium sp. CF080]|uniref:hypothetical protein n=1 Tax=Rhizobium sp. (strain CF080) TaxID=1144310 RepID=UPI000271BCBA|nr:hypothetical protein [Rhizobium sp. CF080]EUB97268.1 hypothetical protein PMI07_000844 [Rhizobium sp. CF080]